MNHYFELIKQITRKYLIEIVLIVIALILGIVSFAIFLNSATPTNVKMSFQNDHPKPIAKKMYAEISGAVVKPGIYELPSESRLNDLLKLANGLSNNADKNYFTRNFNLARYVQDQEKVYIPSTNEINQGLFNDNPSVQTNKPSSQTVSAGESGKININAASADELDLLPGIGTVTAQKIIDNRPYQAVDELLTKKIVKQNIFDSIKDRVTTE